MDVADELIIRADAEAEGFLAEALQAREALEFEDFSEDEVGVLRAAFKVGWLMGFDAALKGPND
jgi:hypothetical protein